MSQITFQDFEKAYAQNNLLKVIAQFLFHNEKCFMCGKKMRMIEDQHGKNPLSYMDFFSGEFLFHLKSTHGICYESFQSIITQRVNDYV